MEKKQYIYLGNNIEFKNFSFSKGVVYFEKRQDKRNNGKISFDVIFFHLSNLGFHHIFYC